MPNETYVKYDDSLKYASVVRQLWLNIPDNALFASCPRDCGRSTWSPSDRPAVADLIQLLALLLRCDANFPIFRVMLVFEFKGQS